MQTHSHIFTTWLILPSRSGFFYEYEMVAGEIRELTNLLNNRNKNQEIREHICEISEYYFRLFTGN